MWGCLGLETGNDELRAGAGPERESPASLSSLNTETAPFTSFDPIVMSTIRVLTSGPETQSPS